MINEPKITVTCDGRDCGAEVSIVPVLVKCGGLVPFEYFLCKTEETEGAISNSEGWDTIEGRHYCQECTTAENYHAESYDVQVEDEEDEVATDTEENCSDCANPVDDCECDDE